MSHTGMHEAFAALQGELQALKAKHQRVVDAAQGALDTLVATTPEGAKAVSRLFAELSDEPVSYELKPGDFDI